MDRFRFLTAGREPRPDAGRHRRGRAGRPRADRGRHRGGPRRAASGVRPRRAPDDRAGPGARSWAASATGGRSGSPILLEVDNRDWANWTRVMQVEPLSEEEAAELAALADEGNKRAPPITRVRPGPRGPRRRAQVRLQRRPQRARALLRARDDGAGRGGRDRPGVPARARDRGLVVHRGGGRRGHRPGALHAVARRGRRVAAALPGPRGGAGDDRADRRGAVERRHRRRRVRGRRPRGADRPRQLRPLGPAPGRRARRAP